MAAPDHATGPNPGLPAGSAPAGDSKAQHHGLLMARDRMNLAAVRTRTQDLQKTLLQAIFDLETAPERYDWSNVLERFAVINAQLHSITAQIVPLLEHYVVYPKVVDQQMAPVVPIMLSSKLLPEQQLQHAEQLHDLQRTHGPLSSKAQSGHVQRMSESLNRMVDHLTIAKDGQTASGLLDPIKGDLRRGIARTSIVPVKAPAAGGQRLGAVQARSQRPQGADLFLAVATSGYGLRVP